MSAFFPNSLSKISQSTFYKAPRTIKQIANGKNIFQVFSLFLTKQSKKTGEVTYIETLTINCSTEFENFAFSSFYEMKGGIKNIINRNISI